jgi:antitoxin (DNA-binding transcriptional repressor) of toxin-antitoxin stability system
MKTLSVGDFKSRFSEVLKALEAGEEIAVSYGKQHETIGVFVPYATYKKKRRLKLGLLAGKATFRFGADFKITDEELLGL